MNRELSCYVVRDLLPAYIEDLTGEETAADIRAHLAGCPDCSAMYASMAYGESPEAAEQAAAETAEENRRDIDYLKKVRTGTRR